jgi:hypothetical protein
VLKSHEVTVPADVTGPYEEAIVEEVIPTVLWCSAVEFNQKQWRTKAWHFKEVVLTVLCNTRNCSVELGLSLFHA